MFKSNWFKVTVTEKLTVAKKYVCFQKIGCVSLQQSNFDSEECIRRGDTELSSRKIVIMIVIVTLYQLILYSCYKCS